MPRFRPLACGLILAVGAFLPALAGDAAPSDNEPAFLKEDDDAMTKMMAAMAIKPTGDVDRDFVAMMEPHHQGAIEMAKAVLRYGKNEQLRRIAQEIIVDQLQEIAAMRLAVGEPLPPAIASPTQPAPAPTGGTMDMSGMQMNPSTQEPAQ